MPCMSVSTSGLPSHSEIVNHWYSRHGEAANTMFAISLVSFASLLLELGLTRLFSVVLFYHFAFLAISVALLGLGAGGVFAYVKKQWLLRWTSRQLGQRLCVANAIVTLLVLEVDLHLPISLELTRGNF